MWIIISIVLAINSIWLLKVNKDLANRNEYLIRQADNNSRPHKLMMDKENKVIVFRFATSSISKDGLRQLSDNAKDLKEKGYDILVMDNTFDFSNINISKEEVEKLKRVINDKED
ncbi:hypothetical protein [Mammaliicoccus sp. H-M33]|uniref:hypothetical protein n=1 Tax=Mammaliicoccus sp. H-M33 TaxID=2898692 RepID=UPI001EFB10EF|nr:hypothetical protein [Mammaliicoccus sp. H-M33]